jgi:hypothetical protein
VSYVNLADHKVIGIFVGNYGKYFSHDHLAYFPALGLPALDF